MLPSVEHVPIPERQVHITEAETPQQSITDWLEPPTNRSQDDLTKGHNVVEAFSLLDHTQGECLPCFFEHRHAQNPQLYPRCNKQSCLNSKCHRLHTVEYMRQVRSEQTRRHRQAKKAYLRRVAAELGESGARHPSAAPTVTTRAGTHMNQSRSSLGSSSSQSRRLSSASSNTFDPGMQIVFLGSF